jgi:hypothetical protein
VVFPTSQHCSQCLLLPILRGKTKVSPCGILHFNNCHWNLSFSEAHLLCVFLSCITCSYISFVHFLFIAFYWFVGVLCIYIWQLFLFNFWYFLQYRNLRNFNVVIHTTLNFITCGLSYLNNIKMTSYFKVTFNL